MAESSPFERIYRAFTGDQMEEIYSAVTEEVDGILNKYAKELEKDGMNEEMSKEVAGKLLRLQEGYHRIIASTINPELKNKMQSYLEEQMGAERFQKHNQQIAKLLYEVAQSLAQKFTL